jgi:hypothetical protein
MDTTEVRLPDNLVLHPVRDEKDICGFTSFMTSQLNVVEGITSNCLLRFHPLTNKGEFLIVRDTAENLIVSTSCLIPWSIRFAGVSLKCAQVEMILTHEYYRKRGLVSAQMHVLHEIIQQKGYDIVIIWGIPYFYRQFGYSYAIDGSVGQLLPSYRVEGETDPVRDCYTFRGADTGDIPLLSQLHNKQASRLDIYVERSDAYWRYMIQSIQFPIFMIEKKNEYKPVGYIIYVKHGRRIHIFESGIDDQKVGYGVLRALKNECDEILINWPFTGSLVKLAESLGSDRIKNTQWLIKIPNLVHFLMRIRPVLDRRLAESGCRDVSRQFVLNLFLDAYRISIGNGKIEDVESIGFVDTSMGSEGGNLNLMPDAFMRLMTGQNSIDQLCDFWPDTVVKTEDRYLVDVLFPRMITYLYTPFHYYGAEMYSMEEKYLGYYL